ncbi:hypothetical protein KEM63_04490 [Halopseudomonas nanhaiensis]|uniref:PA0061/PA0062 family lipoprotein n=1 Tax=Halopseudomonas nanhaiensis TaxID=2830842 RepID=UPI001CBFE356|nr:hypothetical protein [Halopseudomonas nanhaiensis]UAW99234.1 hypothetical protein KEM63_04490 [Halopseudomonas nanhaiensis]
MRKITFAVCALLMAGCAQQPSEPVAEGNARIEFDTAPMDQLSAYRLDGELVDGIRFPDLTPGSHELQVRFRYEMPGGAGGGGTMGEPQYRTCILGVAYDNFAAGETYVFSAQRLGWQSVGSLRGSSSEKLASAQTIRCSPGF